MHDDRLRNEAKDNVCACYRSTVDWEEVTEDLAHALSANGMALHYMDQIYNPQALATFIEELRRCPAYEEAV